MHVPSFIVVTLTVSEKSATKIYPMRMDGMTEGKGKSSIAPLFQSWRITKIFNVFYRYIGEISRQTLLPDTPGQPWFLTNRGGLKSL